MRDELPAITIAIAGQPQPSSSTITTVGAYVVVLATALPELAVTLTSVYVGEIGDDSAVTHLRLTPAHAAELEHRLLTGQQPGETHARSCLLDHTAELQQLLGELGDEPVSIDVAAAALKRAADAWATDEPRRGGDVTDHTP